MADNAAALANDLLSFVVGQLNDAASASLPGLRVPAVYGGHRTDEATPLDLAYVFGLLAEAGIPVVAGVPCRHRALELVTSVDQRRVDTFASYRMGETINRLGGLEVVPGWDDTARYRAVATVASRSTPPKVRANELPRNYAVVAARCLRAAQVLRPGADPDLDEFVGRVSGLFTETGTGWVNDSPWGPPTVFDIYTADMYLFAEPLVDRLGAVWRDGFRRVLADLDDIVQPGGAVNWGRSVGSLGLAMTIELASIGSAHGLLAEPGRWLARAEQALIDLRWWFRDGIVAAHQDRATMSYRGPARRLQLTFDLLGKLVLAALALRANPSARVAAHSEAWPDVDRLITFDESTQSHVWAFRSRHLSFVLPLVCGWGSDYAPIPRSPGLFEPPTTGHPTFLPVQHRGSAALIPAGTPTTVVHTPRTLTVTHDGWAPAGGHADHDKAEGGRRVATYRVFGAQLAIDETLTFDVEGDPLTVSVPETSARPLRVSTLGMGDAPRSRRIDTEGIAEWRSFWSTLPVVHQIERETSRAVQFSVRLDPRIRIASLAYGHPYDRGLYDPTADEVILSPLSMPGEHLERRLARHDIVHMAWPEWWTGVDPDWTRKAIASIRATNTPVVWTMHNLLPHLDKSANARLCYQQWAQLADVVIHHSDWGKGVALSSYEFGPHTEHVVIAHGHWGHRYAPYAEVTRESVERELGLEPAPIRLAVVGAPRAEKNTQSVIDAFVAANRSDMQLLVRADDGESIPDHPNIVVDHGHMPDDLYHRRLRAVDALVLPFASAGMLTTGTAFDAIGAGVAAITSDWGFFDETFDGADLRYGSTTADLTQLLRTVTAADLAASRDAMIARRAAHDWHAIAQRTLEVMVALRAKRAGLTSFSL